MHEPKRNASNGAMPLHPPPPPPPSVIAEAWVDGRRPLSAIREATEPSLSDLMGKQGNVEFSKKSSHKETR
jgi:hypothetical protein